MILFDGCSWTYGDELDDPERDRALSAALDRLCAPEHMGGLFKIALLVPAGEGLPAGFASLHETGLQPNERRGG